LSDSEPLPSQADDPQGHETPETKEAPIEDHEARGAEYYREQYEGLRAKYQEATRYQGIIQRLESDPDLLNVLEKHIAGEMVEARTIFDDEGTQEEKPKGRTGKTEVTPDDIEAARQRGALEEQARSDLKAFTSRLAHEGIPAYMIDKYLAWINNPNGLTAQDMWAAFYSIEERTKKPESKPAVEQKKGGPKGAPIASVSGETDRPDTSKSIRQASNGVRFVANANDIV
jgi:hypothetical protein